jgi:hypothetical protein
VLVEDWGREGREGNVQVREKWSCGNKREREALPTFAIKIHFKVL